MPPVSTNPIQTAADALVGTEISGTYQIIRKIGAGGMGSVYEAKHVRLPKRFAIKVMLPEVAADQVSFERFRREAETTSTLGNAHIAEVVDFNFLPDGSPYMVMEYLEGEDLGIRLQSETTLEPAQVVALVSDISSALSSAHAKGIVHRDIKPANVFLSRREGDVEIVKLLDFGAAKSKSKRNSNLTAAGQVVGTPWYMSPEQARGAELDARSDQFSLAVVAFEALTGRLPFEAEEPMQVLFKIVDDPPVSIRTYNPSLSLEVDQLFERALAKEPESRFESVAEFASQLKAALGVEAGKAAASGRTMVTALPVDEGGTAPTRMSVPAVAANTGKVSRAPVLEQPSQRPSEKTPEDAPGSPATEQLARRQTTEPALSVRRSNRAALGVGVLGAVLILGLGAFLFLNREPPLAPRSAPTPPPPSLLPPKAMVPPTVPSNPPAAHAEVMPAPSPAPTAKTPAEMARPAHSAEGHKPTKKRSGGRGEIITDLGPD